MDPLHRARIVRAVAAIPATGLLIGAAVGLLLPDLPNVPILLLMSASAVGAWWAWRGHRTRLLIAAVVAAFVAGGAILSNDGWRRAWRPPLRIAFEDLARVERRDGEAAGRRLPIDDEVFAIIEGVLRADASETVSGVSLSLDVDALVGRAWPSHSSIPTSGGIVVTVVGDLAKGRLGEWRAGRRVRVPAQLHRAARYLDPGVPDHERALARRGTTLVGSVKSGGLVEVLARGSALDEAIGGVRAFSRRAIADAVGRWSAQSAAIVAAIVIGDRAGLDQDVQRRLQEAGTYHVIAISGGNIAILAGLLLGAFRFAGWLGRSAMLLSIALLLAYARLVGDGASVDRATLMAVVYFGSRAFDQRSPPLNALAVVAALLVAADPLAIADPAFLLTFGATLAILVVVPAITRSSAGHGDRHTSAGSAISAFLALRRAIVGMFAASVAAEAILFPVGAIVFSRVTFAGLALNFLAIPLMALAQIAGMAVAPLALVSRTAASAAGWIAHVGAAGLVWSADLVRFAPAVTYRLAPPSWIAVLAYYAALMSWWRWRRRSAAAAAIVAAAWILVDPRALLASRGDGRLHATFLDVGQGDSALLIFPRGSTMLVDAGGLGFASSFDIGDRVVAPVLREAGVRRLDYFVLTHGDPDHIGGAPAIVREFRPREVWEGIPVPRFEPLTVLRMAAQASGARWANVYAGDHVSIDGVDVAALSPRPADWERQKVRNDDSLVLEVRWQDVSFVLTGDAGRASEQVITSPFETGPLRILKVPHHGSLTSSSAEFLQSVRPRLAVVSVGRSNHYGHPAREVLERYRAIDATILRTDLDGAVTMTTDGRTLTTHTFAGRKSPAR